LNCDLKYDNSQEKLNLKQRILKQKRFGVRLVYRLKVRVLEGGEGEGKKQSR